jgi:hypothetical protein
MEMPCNSLLAETFVHTLLQPRRLNEMGSWPLSSPTYYGAGPSTCQQIAEVFHKTFGDVKAPQPGSVPERSSVPVLNSTFESAFPPFLPVRRSDSSLAISAEQVAPREEFAASRARRRLWQYGGGGLFLGKRETKKRGERQCPGLFVVGAVRQFQDLKGLFRSRCVPEYPG